MRISPSIRPVPALAVALLLAAPFGASAQGLIVEDTNGLWVDGGPGARIRLVQRAIVFDTSGSTGALIYADDGFWSLAPVESLNVTPSVVGGSTRVVAVFDSVLQLESESRHQRFVADSDNDAAAQAIFSWHQDGTDDGDRLMQLNGNDGNVPAENKGKLLVGATVEINQNFDLAESFWESEPVEAGEIVVVDPHRGDAVRQAQHSYQRTLLGVVSERPAIVMGGGAFSLEALRGAWGEEVAVAFERQRPDLEARALAGSAELRQEAERLASPTSYAANLRTAAVESRIEGLDGADASGIRAPARLGPERLESAYAQARQIYERDLFDAVVERFFSERFAAVALAGRVRVKADASFGAIRPGDSVTSSPVAGVAMKATAAGPILGMALEGLEAGSGRVLVLVDRGWYAGEGESLAGRNGDGQAMGEAMAPLLAAKDGEIEELRDRLAVLEARLGIMAARRSAAASKSQSRPASGE